MNGRNKVGSWQSANFLKFTTPDPQLEINDRYNGGMMEYPY